MGETQGSSSGDIFTPPVVVRPPTRGTRPYRRVEIYGRAVGKAFDAADVAEFIRRAGVDEPDLSDPDLVGWRGGDQTVWSATGHGAEHDELPDGGLPDDGQPSGPTQAADPAESTRPEAAPEASDAPDAPDAPTKPEEPVGPAEPAEPEDESAAAS
ncbi:hypothetical protein [Kitasatospora sp. NPDC088346]|uniref:hypothetical protein n=1 Tax=Kitasatospora sp. NPDC088346 TaxID=3364073 RepID=UPI0038106437